MMRQEINTICFDQGGTLLSRVPLKDLGKKDFKKIIELSGVSGEPMSMGKMLSKRDKNYKKWSLRTNIEETEENIWKKWLLPEADSELIEKHCSELTLLFSHSKGERVFRDDAYKTITVLSSRGYRLGLITNTVSRKLVPMELDSIKIRNYFQVIEMSSITGLRKPLPEMFLSVCKSLGISPSECAYVGDAPDRDVKGPRNAGYGMSIILDTEGEVGAHDLPLDLKPDRTIKTLSDLLNIFD